MRILQLCNKLTYPPDEGGSVAVLNISFSLVAAGHEVTVMSFVSEKHYPNDSHMNELKQKIRLKLVKQSASFNKWQIIRNFMFSRMPVTAERFLSDRFRNELVKLLKSSSYDIIQAEGTYMLPYIDTIREHSKALISFRSHNAEHKIWTSLSHHTGSPLKKFYFRSLAKRLKRMEENYIDKYDVLVPISNNDLAFYQSAGNSKPVLVCGTGYPAVCSDIHLPTGTRESLFYIGSLDWLPNQQGILWFINKVFTKLIRQYPSVTFNIAGRNAPSGFLQKIRHPNICYHGAVNDAAGFVQKMGISVVPLFSGSGIRVKIIESMAMGKPVVATTAAAEGLEVTDNVNILLADAPDQFIEKISALLDDGSLYDRLAKGGHDLVTAVYNNSKMADSLIEFYKLHLK